MDVTLEPLLRTATAEVQEQGISILACFEDAGIDRVQDHHEVHEVEPADAWVRILVTK